MADVVRWRDAEPERRHQEGRRNDHACRPRLARLIDDDITDPGCIVPRQLFLKYTAGGVDVDVSVDQISLRWTGRWIGVSVFWIGSERRDGSDLLECFFQHALNAMHL